MQGLAAVCALIGVALECQGKKGPTRRLELVVSGTSLSGQLSRPPGNFFGETRALKLTRVQ
jgi:hypothetical protein